MIEIPLVDKDYLLIKTEGKGGWTLANQLYFELISGDSVQQRRDAMEKHVIKS